MSCLNFLKRFYLFIFRRGERREKERERNIKVWLPHTCPSLGTWPTTQACALTGNRTRDPLVCRYALNPLNHTSQGSCLNFPYTPRTGLPAFVLLPAAIINTAARRILSKRKSNWVTAMLKIFQWLLLSGVVKVGVLTLPYTLLDWTLLSDTISFPLPLVRSAPRNTDLSRICQAFFCFRTFIFTVSYLLLCPRIPDCLHGSHLHFILVSSQLVPGYTDLMWPQYHTPHRFLSLLPCYLFLHDTYS